MISDKTITLDAAREWIGKNDFSEEKMTYTGSDSRRCLDIIMQHTIKIKDFNVSIAEMLAEVKHEKGNHVYDIELKRIGIKYEYINGAEFVVISNSHKAIGSILRDTPWPKQWGRIIKRISGTSEKSCVRFCESVRTPAVYIPWEQVYGDEVEAS